MPVSKGFPHEVRFHVSQEMRDQLKELSKKRGVSLAPYLRELVQRDLDSIERRIVCRQTDDVIFAIAEKLGVEIPPNCGT